MLFVLGGFHVIFALNEFANAAWIAANVYGTWGGPLWLWGILDLVFAGLIFFAGYDLLRGGTFGRMFGLVMATVSAIRWFFYLPWAPVLAMVVIAIDVLIIYGLTMASDYFHSAQGGQRHATT
jgi:hypothetical protein